MQYAEAELPQVEALLDDTVQAVIHVGSALAPLGGELITVADGALNFIDAIPVPVLEGQLVRWPASGQPFWL